MRIKTAVLGPGAVGGTFAVRFLEARYHTICVAPHATVQLMGYSGISYESNGSPPIVVRPEVAERLMQPVALLLVTVKAHQLEEAIERVEPEAVANGVVLPLLNGLEHMDVLRERFGDRVAAGSLSRFEAYRVGRMQVVQKSFTGLVTIASETLPASDVERVAGILENAGIGVEIQESEKRVLWQKVVRLAVLAPATAISGRPVGELRENYDWRRRMEAAIDEACAVATAEGVNLMPSAQWSRIVDMDYNLTTSAARDVAARRPTEIDAITGAVARAGERLGVPCPVLEELAEDAAKL